MRRSLRLPRGEAGFSLVELILVIVVLSILSIGFGKFLTKSMDGYRWTADQSNHSGAARLALDRVMREVGQVPDPTSHVSMMLPHVLEFDGNDGTTRQISWSGVPGDPLWYALGDADYVLMSSIDSLGFGYFDMDGAATTDPAQLRRVTTTLIAGDATHRVRYRTAIHVRNHS